MKADMERKTLFCLRCSHVWLSSKQTSPITCPRCKRRDWNKQGVKPQGQRVDTPFYLRGKELARNP